MQKCKSQNRVLIFVYNISGKCFWQLLTAFTDWTHCGDVLPDRIKELQSHLSLVEQFDQALIKFSQWSETILSTLHSASQVNISNLQAAATQVKVRTMLNGHATPSVNLQMTRIIPQSNC